jgi:rod shape-determining protein MreC
MDFFLSRYRNITVLLLVIVAQLLLIAYQVKSNKDVPLVRVWAVTVVTPVEQALEVVRAHTWGFVEDYFVLLGVKGENDRLKSENGQLKLENQYLKTELNTADRAQALSVFQAHSQSKTVAARIIGNGTGANSKVVFVDRVG